MLKYKNAGVTLDTSSLTDTGVIEGYASRWDVIDSHDEAVLPGAFKASLARSKREGRGVKMLYQHDRHTPIGVWDELAEDATGLRVRGRLLKDVSPKALEVYGLVREGAIDEMSIGYFEVETKKDPARPGIVLLKQLDLFEVSIVTFGSLRQSARIDSVKSLFDGGAAPTVREFEHFLRDAGFSKGQAASIAGKAAPHLRGEPEAKADEVIAFLQAFERA